MKTHFAALVLLALAVGAPAQEPVPVQLAPAPADRFTAEQLEQLLGPIALYPDALIALILPAATAPADIVLAARYLENAGDPTKAAGRTWDESVKSLLYYAEVVRWMDTNLDWTKQVGEAFRAQPAETMAAIQRLRAKARAAGTLVDSPQQQVLVDRDVIALVPTQPDVLYVPYYDPLVVYSPRPAYAGTSGFVTYSSPFAVGAWLSFDCDWRRRTVWTVDRHGPARGPHDWRRPVFPDQPGYVNDPRRRPWQPAPHLPRPAPVTASVRVEIARPVPIAAPPRPNVPRDDFANRRSGPAERPRLIPGRPAEGNYSRATAPARAPTVPPAPALSEPTAPPAVAGAPAPIPAATGTPPANRRGDPDRGRNAYGDRANRPPPPQTTPTTTPAAHVVGPVAPSPRNNPPVTGNLVGPSGPRATPPSPPHNPPPATRAAPPPPPPAATPAAPPAPASEDERKRRGPDGDLRKQAN